MSRTTFRPNGLESEFFGWHAVTPIIHASARSSVFASLGRGFRDLIADLIARIAVNLDCSQTEEFAIGPVLFIFKSRFPQGLY
jgi:hypothetical protein